MAEALTIARPYAEAVFRLAKTKNALSAWSDMLQLAATVTSDERIRALIGNPKFPLNIWASCCLGYAVIS